MKTPPLPRIVALALALLCSAAFAQSDPPGRVGRISWVEGEASLHSPDTEGWNPALRNYPVTEGDALWTTGDARLELQIGPATLRMDGNTEIDVLRLDDETTLLRIDEGVVNLHLHAVPEGGLRLVTARGDVDLLRAGSYHIETEAPDRGGVEVTTLEGLAEIDGPRGRLQIRSGERAAIDGNPPAVTLTRGGPTDFDDWAAAREARTAAPVYVSPAMTGYQDLDRYGRWAEDDDYGPVWYPVAVPDGWEPYRFGHWAYIAPWGWTWVDDAPWGFAPFHYGRWAYVRGRWGWCPGQVVVRPVYAPALVAFIGGANWSVTLSAGGVGPAVGWIPLGPREVFHPYYHTSTVYVRNINITHIHNGDFEHRGPPRHYLNERAATVVPMGVFTRSGAVHRSTLRVGPGQLEAAPRRPALDNLRPPAPARRTEGAQRRAGIGAPPESPPRATERRSAPPAQRREQAPEQRDRPERSRSDSNARPATPYTAPSQRSRESQSERRRSTPAPAAPGSPGETRRVQPVTPRPEPRAPQSRDRSQEPSAASRSYGAPQADRQWQGETRNAQRAPVQATPRGGHEYRAPQVAAPRQTPQVRDGRQGHDRNSGGHGGEQRQRDN